MTRNQLLEGIAFLTIGVLLVFLADHLAHMPPAQLARIALHLTGLAIGVGLCILVVVADDLWRNRRNKGD